MLLEQRVSPVFDVLVVLHAGRIGADTQTCMQAAQYVFERRGPWTRWVWINFHLAVWISIAYAIGVAIEQHLDWLDDDATFGRRR